MGPAAATEDANARPRMVRGRALRLSHDSSHLHRPKGVRAAAGVFRALRAGAVRPGDRWREVYGWPRIVTRSSALVAADCSARCYGSRARAVQR